MAEVVELIHYPVKGCAGVPVRTAVVEPAGLAHDRAFLVLGPDGAGRTQRRDPKLAVVSPRVRAEAGGERLTLRAPGMEVLRLDVDTAGERREVTLFGQPLRGIDQGDEAAAWFSEVLGAPSRLVRVPPENGRVTDGATPGTSRYADSSAVHLLTRTTLDDFNARLAERGSAPLPMARFRPNIVVDGWDGRPYAEDRVRRLRLGEVELGYTKLAVRCAVTLVDQRTGTKAGPEPLRTLAGYRRAEGGGVVFGSKFSVVRPGALAVGDGVEVADRAAPER